MLCIDRQLRPALVAGLALAFGAAGAPAHTVNASALNVRSGPGYGYRVIATLSRGTVVNTVSRSGAWTKIDRPRTGWVYSSYLSNTSHSGGSGSSSGSIATGGRVGGSSYSGWVHCPDSFYGGYGYYSSWRRWGRPRMINGLLAMGRRWRAAHPGKSIAVGDISKYGGGYLAGHVSHRYGRDVDLRPMTTGATAGYTSVGWSNYSTYYNTQYARLQRAVWSVSVMLHNNRRIPGTTYWPNHYNHFHTRIY